MVGKRIEAYPLGGILGPVEAATGSAADIEDAQTCVIFDSQTEVFGVEVLVSRSLEGALLNLALRPVTEFLSVLVAKHA